MTDDDDHRAEAAHAQKMADRSISDIDKASWLRIAQGWLSLIRHSEPSTERSAQERFDDENRERGTRQDENKSSN